MTFEKHYESLLPKGLWLQNLYSRKAVRPIFYSGQPEFKDNNDVIKDYLREK